MRLGHYTTGSGLVLAMLGEPASMTRRDLMDALRLMGYSATVKFNGEGPYIWIPAAEGPPLMLGIPVLADREHAPAYQAFVKFAQEHWGMVVANA